MNKARTWKDEYFIGRTAGTSSAPGAGASAGRPSRRGAAAADRGGRGAMGGALQQRHGAGGGGREKC